MYFRSFLAFTIVAILLMFSCKHEPDVLPDPDPDPDKPIVLCDPDSVYFKNDILPLLIQSCGVIGCHDPGTAQDGIVLTDYASIINTGGVRPGRPDNSDIFEVITDDDPADRLPPLPNNPLSQDDIALIENGCYRCPRQSPARKIAIRHWVALVARFGPLFKTLPGLPLREQSTGRHKPRRLQPNCGCRNNGSLLGVIKWESGYTAMPLNGNKLTDCEIIQIENWIQNGTPQN